MFAGAAVAATGLGAIEEVRAMPVEFAAELISGVVAQIEAAEAGRFRKHQHFRERRSPCEDRVRWFWTKARPGSTVKARGAVPKW